MLEVSPSDRTHSEYGRDTLAAYVFSRLRAEDRLGELLMLPAEFNEELRAWIKNQVLTLLVPGRLLRSHAACGGDHPPACAGCGQADSAHPMAA